MAVYGLATEYIETLPEGQYAAVIDSITPVVPDPNKPRDPRFDKPQLVISWRLTEVEADEPDENGSRDIVRKQWANEPQKGLDPRSTLYKIFSAVLNNGQPLDKDSQYDTRNLVNKSALLFWGAYVREDGTQGYKVLSVSPPRRAAGGGTVRRKPVEEPTEAPIDAIIDPDQI